VTDITAELTCWIHTHGVNNADIDDNADMMMTMLFAIDFQHLKRVRRNM
jgi:hypothetical protein